MAPVRHVELQREPLRRSAATIRALSAPEPEAAQSQDEVMEQNLVTRSSSTEALHDRLAAQIHAAQGSDQIQTPTRSHRVSPPPRGTALATNAVDSNTKNENLRAQAEARSSAAQIQRPTSVASSQPSAAAARSRSARGRAMSVAPASQRPVQGRSTSPLIVGQAARGGDGQSVQQRAVSLGSFSPSKKLKGPRGSPHRVPPRGRRPLA